MQPTQPPNPSSNRESSAPQTMAEAIRDIRKRLGRIERTLIDLRDAMRKGTIGTIE